MAIDVKTYAQLAARVYDKKLKENKMRPLQNTSLHLFADSRNPNTGFRLFSPQITPDFTQISP